jgi:hypothetical protein
MNRKKIFQMANLLLNRTNKQIHKIEFLQCGPLKVSGVNQYEIKLAE